MKTLITAGLLSVAVISMVGCGKKEAEESEPVVEEPKQLVYVGDTAARVDLMLGEPSVSFPKNGTDVRWYAGYEVVISNKVVISVKMKPPKSEEELAEKEVRAQLADQRLRDSYAALKGKEDLSYKNWLRREEQRLKEAREKRAAVLAYEERKAKEDRTRIIADAIKDCGCRRGHYCGRCR